MSQIIDKLKDKLGSDSSNKGLNSSTTINLLGKPIGPVGYGLMGLTWRKTPPSQEQAFKAMRAALVHGANFWNGGEIYGSPERNSLHLLNEYFTKYPEDSEKVVLSIKGGYNPAIKEPDGSEANVKRSIDECLRVLDGKKFLDLFECARFDPNVPPEQTVAAINEYVKQGKIGGISLSEVNADTIRKAAKVAKISAVEVEFSLFSTDILTNGVAQACAELNIPIIAYSPLGRGFLTGQIKKPEDVPDHVRMFDMPRFTGEAFYENLKLVKQVESIATKRGASPAQVAISWVHAKSGKDGLPTIIPIPGATTEERIAENMSIIELSTSELAEIDDILSKFTVVGGRYAKAQEKYLEQ